MFYDMMGYRIAEEPSTEIGPYDLPPLEHASFVLTLEDVLLDPAVRPDRTYVPQALVATLNRLAWRCRGAVAILSERTAGRVAEMLPGFGGVIMGCHGTEILQYGETRLTVDPDPALVQVLQTMADTFARKNSAYFVEPKPTGVALHFGARPALRGEAYHYFDSILRDVSGFALVHGSHCFELCPKSPTRMDVILDVIGGAPFKGRTPVYAGQSFADEPVFEQIQAMGGRGIRVGSGHTTADYRLDDADAVRGVLVDVLSA